MLLVQRESLWRLDVLPVFVWVLSGDSGFLPQFTDIQVVGLG